MTLKLEMDDIYAYENILLRLISDLPFRKAQAANFFTSAALRIFF